MNIFSFGISKSFQKSFLTCIDGKQEAWLFPQLQGFFFYLTTHNSKDILSIMVLSMLFILLFNLHFRHYLLLKILSLKSKSIYLGWLVSSIKYIGVEMRFILNKFVIMIYFGNVRNCLIMVFIFRSLTGCWVSERHKWQHVFALFAYDSKSLWHFFFTPRVKIIAACTW